MELELSNTAQRLSLSIVAGYNQSDSDGGWFHFLTGMTAYISDPVENTLDPTYSVNVIIIRDFPLITTNAEFKMVPNEVPILTMRQIHTKKLGAPYSSCVKEEDHSLMYYQNYTKG